MNTLKFLLLFLVAAPLLPALESSTVPLRFSASIGGGLGRPSYRVELEEGNLKYFAFEGGTRKPESMVITPTAAQWQEFRKALDEVNVWQWRANYPMTQTDVTEWKLEIAVSEKSIKAQGASNYPDKDGKPNNDGSPTLTFQRYLEAVSKLLGGKTFK